MRKEYEAPEITVEKFTVYTAEQISETTTGRYNDSIGASLEEF